MNNEIEQKSFDFAVRIVKLCRYIKDNKHENIISSQLLKSGTSIGANITEAENAQSNADFLSKMSIALKEASETKYWIRLLKATEYVSDNQIKDLLNESIEIEKMLSSIVKTVKSNN